METQLHASIAETLDVLLARLATREPGALDALVCATQADLRRIAHRERRVAHTDVRHQIHRIPFDMGGAIRPRRLEFVPHSALRPDR